VFAGEIKTAHTTLLSVDSNYVLLKNRNASWTLTTKLEDDIRQILRL